MTSFKLNLLTAAAAFVAATATASAQSNLSASVPFSFSIGSRTVLAAGDYKVGRAGANPDAWIFVNQETGHKTMVALGQRGQSHRGDPSRLEFQCHEGQCALQKIQVGNGEMGYELRAPNWTKSEEVALIVVPLTRDAE